MIRGQYLPSLRFFRRNIFIFIQLRSHLVRQFSDYAIFRKSVFLRCFGGRKISGFFSFVHCPSFPKPSGNIRLRRSNTIGKAPPRFGPTFPPASRWSERLQDRSHSPFLLKRTPCVYLQIPALSFPSSQVFGVICLLSTRFPIIGYMSYNL